MDDHKKLNPAKVLLWEMLAMILMINNLFMHIIVLGIGGWVMNIAIDHSLATGLKLPEHLFPIHFPMGNAATGLFVISALIAALAGVLSFIPTYYLIIKNIGTLEDATYPVTIAWSLTFLAMGFACKEIELQNRNAYLITMEMLIIILSATQPLCIRALYGTMGR